MTQSSILPGGVPGGGTREPSEPGTIGVQISPGQIALMRIACRA